MPANLMQQLSGMGWAVLYAIVGGLAGMVLMIIASTLLPRLIEKLTPNIDEEKEIARGNRAVADYFGRVVSACIIGVSIVMAAAILGGVLAALL